MPYEVTGAKCAILVRAVRECEASASRRPLQLFARVLISSLALSCLATIWQGSSLAESEELLISVRADASREDLSLHWTLNDAGAVEDPLDRAAAAIAFTALRERLPRIVADLRESSPNSTASASARMVDIRNDSRVVLSLQGSAEELESLAKRVILAPVAGDEYRLALERSLRERLDRVLVSGIPFGQRPPSMVQWSSSGLTDSDVFDLAEANVARVQVAYSRWFKLQRSVVDVEGPLERDELTRVVHDVLAPAGALVLPNGKPREWERWDPRVRVEHIPRSDRAQYRSDGALVVEIVVLPLRELDDGTVSTAVSLALASQHEAERAGAGNGPAPPVVVDVVFNAALCQGRLALIVGHGGESSRDPVDGARRALEALQDFASRVAEEESDALPPSRVTLELPNLVPEAVARRCLEASEGQDRSTVNVGRALEEGARLSTALDWDDANVLVKAVSGKHAPAILSFAGGHSIVYLTSALPERARVAESLEALLRERPLGEPGKRPEPSLEEVDAALRLAEDGPGLALSRWYAARTLAEAGDHAGAQTHFDVALAINPDLVPALEGSFENALGGLGDAKLALSLAERHVALTPGYAKARLMKARALEALGRITEAHEELTRFVESQPGDSDAWASLGEFRFRLLENLPLAASAYLGSYRNAGHRSVDQTLPIAEMLVAAREARDEEAVREIADLILSWESPGEGVDAREALVRLTGCSLTDSLEAHDLALLLFEELVRIAPRSARAWTMLGHTHSKLGDLVEARASFQHAVKVNPTYGWAWCLLGDVERDNFGELESALEAYRQCSQHYGPTRRDLEVARVLAMLERYEEAAASFEAHLEEDPASADGWREYADLLRTKLDRRSEAEIAEQRALELKHGSVDESGTP